MVVSCSTQDEPIVQNTLINNDSKLKVMKEFSQLLGRTLLNSSNREYVVGLIHNRNDNSESISVNALFGKNVDAKEARLLAKSKTGAVRKVQANNFKISLQKEATEHLDKYPLLKSALSKNTSSNARTSYNYYDEVADYYSDQNLDVYFPYEENFDLNTQN
jgi:hypothetical protein